MRPTPLATARATMLATTLAALLGAALPGPAAAAAPFNFDTAPGRLPKNVVPTDYTIAIVPNAQARTLTGTERITLDFRAATATIVFNTLNQRLSQVRLDGRAVQRVVTSDEQQLTTVTLPRPAAPGRHVLSFSYQGKIESGPVGLFAQPFVKADGTHDLMLSTQFEATDARRMFPCWDEPAFRATFQLSATVPADWDTVSNMPVATRQVQGPLATTTFQRTPRMPSYLVEFSAGKLGSISATSGGVKFSIWAPRGQEKYGAEALANAQQILADYNDYFGVPYPLPKLDSIAVPGGFQGAMENWGAITYNDQALLLTPASTLRDRQGVFSIQAHEMAHQWNGDLVTMGWWDDLWLNESFASWRAAKETALRHPDWAWWEAEDGSKEGAMAADARQTSHAIEQHVTNELEATSAFDPAITYSKGQAVLRMLEAYLGDDRFRDGIRLYMKARAYSNATSADLWAGLSQASGRDVGAIAAAWTEQPGFPLVHAAAQCDAQGARTLTLTQQRFLLRGRDAAGLRWQVPLRLRVGQEPQTRSVLLTTDGQSVPAGRCDQALSLNADAVGYYRVAYDAATLALDTQQFAHLPSGDRIALLDDQWAGVEAGQQPLASYLALAEAMGGDLNERSWSQVTEALGTIETALRGSPGHDAFTAYARTLLQPLAAKLGWTARPDETPGIQKLRRRVIVDLGLWGDEAVIAQARQRFAAFLLDRNTITPDDQSMILTIVGRHADAAAFAQLHGLAHAARSETELRRYYPALMQVADPALAAQAGAIALGSEIPPQAAALRIQLLFGLADLHPQLAWKLLTDNTPVLLRPIQPFGDFVLAQYVPEVFWNAQPLDTLQAWVRAHVPPALAPNVARGMESARFRLSEKTVLAQAADRYVAARTPKPQ
ncbi:MAG: M1 family metallopeptidase [Burkholderiales bacterium]|nr:M1 family metallopeptidase [Burkholderiales bacterium]MDE2275184.1 M1 family metallopeptidase [Burkholderiales bacterium]